MAREPLPIDPHVPAIRHALQRSRAAVIVAAPGAGKTTRVPPALAEDGRAILLQPRRVAARAIARRISEERGWTLGDDVGWQVRFERRGTERTRLMVVTEGILTARFQHDPLLAGISTVIIDEFHERGVHGDLSLALARQAWLSRNDLRIVVMSATLDAEPVARFLADCPVIEVPGRVHPVEIAYAPARPLARAVHDALRRSDGDVLCFLPGAPEIERATPEVAAGVAGAEIVPLHGSLESDRQDQVFTRGASRRVVLATNIAETSITVPGITAVVDTGFHKVARYDASRAIDSLILERIPQDSADQRAGRAGRTAPGIAIRLWDERDRLRPHREPEIERIDLSATVLDVIAWGGDPATFEWFETPPAGAVDAARLLLQRLGALEGTRLTALGQQMQRLPLHPRLGRILIAAEGAFEAAIVCAVLSERAFMPERKAATACDLLAAVDGFDDLPWRTREAARQIRTLAEATFGAASRRRLDETTLRRGIFSGYPDRVARRRAAGTPRLVLASGHGAMLMPESGVVEGEFLVALDVRAGRAGAGSEARVRIASRIEREWLEDQLTSSVEHRLDRATGTVRAIAFLKYDQLVVAERAAPVDPGAAAELLVSALRERGPSAEEEQLLRRLRFAGHPTSFADLARAAAAGARRVIDVDLANGIGPEARRALESQAPERLHVPSGRTVRLEYQEDGTVQAPVKLQELFGLAETPRIGRHREPVLLLLLAPNGRPVQTTRDLKSFWARTYPEVRKELRGRYPRHPWPEDPWSARPTARTKKRTRRG
jgi:ATP-dependent helicase HrpB